MPEAKPVAAAAGVRILHAALVIGLVLVGATFFLLLRVLGRSFGFGPSIGFVFATVGLAMLAVGFLVLRARVPERSLDESPDDYWIRTDTRGSALMLWVVLEGAGLWSWIGYLLSGHVAPASVALFAIGLLLLARPAQLARDTAA